MSDHSIVGTNDDPGEPEEVCVNCGAHYYGKEAAQNCCLRLVPDGGYEYESRGDRRADNRRVSRARDLASAGIYDEAMREAGKLHHYERSEDLLDSIREQRESAEREVRTDGGDR